MNTTKTVSDLVNHFASMKGIRPHSYELNFDNRTNTLASCFKEYKHKENGIFIPEQSRFVFRFSKRFIPVLSREELVDIVIHEVAHAVTDSDLYGSHGATWRRNAQKMGGSGDRQHISSDRQLEAISKYKGICPQGHTYYRNRKNHDSRYDCPPCVPTINGRKVRTNASLIEWTTLR